MLLESERRSGVPGSFRCDAGTLSRAPSQDDGKKVTFAGGYTLVTSCLITAGWGDMMMMGVPLTDVANAPKKTCLGSLKLLAIRQRAFGALGAESCKDLWTPQKTICFVSDFLVASQVTLLRMVMLLVGTTNGYKHDTSGCWPGCSFDSPPHLSQVWLAAIELVTFQIPILSLPKRSGSQ